MKAHENSIDLKGYVVPRTWTSVEVSVMVLVALFIGMVIGAQAVRWEVRKGVVEIEAMGYYRADCDIEAPMHAEKARARFVKERR